MMRQSPVLIFPVASAYFPGLSGSHCQCSAVCFQCSVSVVSGQCQLSATVVVISPQQPVDSEFGGQNSLGPAALPGCSLMALLDSQLHCGRCLPPPGLLMGPRREGASLQQINKT